MKPSLFSYAWSIIALGAAFFAVHHFFMSPHTSVTNNETLIVGTSPDFPPFEFMENGEMVGFEIDLINEIAKQLGKKITFVTMPFEALLPALQLGKIHLIAAGLTATAERAAHVIFSSPYIDNNPLVIVSLKTAPAQSIAALNGKQIIVNSGYSADSYMSKIQGPIILRLKTPADAFAALHSGHAAAFITAYNTLKPFFKKYDAQAFHVVPIAGTDENTAFAIAPTHQDLYTQIEQTLAIMKNNGSLMALRNKWSL